MPYQSLIPVVDKFAAARALVVGDAMLDHYVVGKVERISPEAPVPILRVCEEFDRVGGAANVAANITELGARAVLVALAGGRETLDATGDALRQRCEIRRVQADLILALDHTVRKSRMLAGPQQMLRVDWEAPVALTAATRARRAELLARHLPDCDIVLVSDYAKGMVDAELLAQLYASGKPVVIDPRPQHGSLYRGATMLTPNRKEALAMLNPDGEITDEDLGQRLGEKLNANILLTLSENGMCLCERGMTPLKIPTRAREVFDVTGAGDTVAATLAAAFAAGCSWREATYLANAAAGIVVGHVGAAAVAPAQLQAAMLKVESSALKI
ncbi:D-beta-D-heptose 7-phosphate kinase [Planctomycetales bacterium]|nr:D-beta-D-heptose 7-phosphate kinase [Planctomycetales bacterium]GHT01728.1 D-beta-D-heptose 7-phosphate kinase [Planctomycetales bacterium]GHT07010.1 D-beta-D-heptose 7-phosphate kinase [Planctomycetales bacterium]